MPPSATSRSTPAGQQPARRHGGRERGGGRRAAATPGQHPDAGRAGRRRRARAPVPRRDRPPWHCASRRSPTSPASWRRCWRRGRTSTARCASSSRPRRTARAARRGAVRDAVRDGGALAAALAEHPGSFPRLYVGLVRAGEAGGTLAATLDRLAELLERERSLAATVTVGDDLSELAADRRDRVDRAAADPGAAAIRAAVRAERSEPARPDAVADRCGRFRSPLGPLCACWCLLAVALA